LYMTISRRLARPLLSSIFLMGGWDAVRNPEGKVKRADPVAQAVATRVPGLPQDTETLVRINGAVMVGAGALLAIGKYPRLAALALIGTILPTTYAGHRFWEETEEATRAQQRIHFFKNLGLLGGLILAAVDTEGAPSLGWRAKQRAERTSRSLQARQRGAARSGRMARESARRSAKAQRAAIAGAQQVAVRAAGRRIEAQKSALAGAQKAAVDSAQRGLAAAEPVLFTGVQKAGELLENVASHVQEIVPVG
jgi:putative oxidoreductase